LADNLDRIERDRKMFETKPRDQLLNVLMHSDKRQICDSLVKVLDSLVSLEEYSHNKGLYPDHSEFHSFIDSNREEIDKHLDHAITAFIGSILSQEG